MKRILLGFCVGVLFSCLNGIAAAASLFKRGFSMLSKFRSGRAVLVCSVSAAAAVCLFFAVGFDTAKGLRLVQPQLGYELPAQPRRHRFSCPMGTRPPTRKATRRARAV